MRVLVLDTALGLCTAAVFDREAPVSVRSEAMLKGHQERLGGLVQGVLAEAGDTAAIARVGVTVGPGSFTGLRVGLAFAQGLATAFGRPLIGVSTLDALADTVERAPAAVMALIDARRGQVYARAFRGGVALSSPQALTLAEAEARIEALGSDVVLAGSGAPLVGGPQHRRHELEGPSPEALVRLTLSGVPQRPVRPLYLRAPDAAPPSRLPGQPRPGRGRSRTVRDDG